MADDSKYTVLSMRMGCGLSVSLLAHGPKLSTSDMAPCVEQAAGLGTSAFQAVPRLSFAIVELRTCDLPSRLLALSPAEGTDCVVVLRRRRLRAIVMRMPHNLALIGDSTRGFAMLALRGGQLRCRMSSNYSERGAMQQQCLLLATPDVCERRHVA